ncbi:MAG: lytic transglycosylase domain-containing protein [Bryobacteraceae bacterium]
MVFFVVALATLYLAAETPPATQNSRSAQLSSVEQQKASVRRQLLGAVPQASTSEPASWFTIPWSPEPIANPPMPSPISMPNADCDPIPTEQIGPLIKDAAARVKLKEELVRSVIERESAFRPCAVSPKGAQGLMQLMPATAAELGVKDPFDPKQNIDGGTRYLKQMLDKYQGNLELALAAYNAGPGRVDRAGGVPPIEETRTYILNILSKFAF